MMIVMSMIMMVRLIMLMSQHKGIIGADEIRTYGMMMQPQRLPLLPMIC